MRSARLRFPSNINLLVKRATLRLLYFASGTSGRRTTFFRLGTFRLPSPGTRKGAFPGTREGAFPGTPRGCHYIWHPRGVPLHLAPTRGATTSGTHEGCHYI